MRIEDEFSSTDGLSTTESANSLYVLYVDLQRVQDKNTLRDRQLTSQSLGLNVRDNGAPANLLEEEDHQRQQQQLSSALHSNFGSTTTLSSILNIDGINDDLDVAGSNTNIANGREDNIGNARQQLKSTKNSVRYHRLDDRLRFANSVVADNSADIIVIDSWPEECLMRTSFPALDNRNEQESYVTKTAYRPNGGRGTMIAVKRKHLVPEDVEKRKNVGLIGLDRLVKRSWMPTAMLNAGCNQSFIHAVDAGPSLLVGKEARYSVRLAVLAFDCGRGYRFQNQVADINGSPAARGSLFSSRLFLNCRSSSFSNNMQSLPTIPAVRSVVGSCDRRTPLLKAGRSNSTVGLSNGRLGGNSSMPQISKEQTNGSERPHLWRRTGSAKEGSEGRLERRSSWVETRAVTPMEEAEERIRIASELKQLKSFISVSLANQLTDRRRRIDPKPTESPNLNGSRPISSTTCDGILALVIGHFGVNSLPLTQSFCSLSKSPIITQECRVNVCDNDRTETMATVWWRNNGSRSSMMDLMESTYEDFDFQRDPASSSGEGDDPLTINDSSALLQYNRNDWLEAEFECRPRMFTLTFQ